MQATCTEATVRVHPLGQKNDQSPRRQSSRVPFLLLLWQSTHTVPVSSRHLCQSHMDNTMHTLAIVKKGRQPPAPTTSVPTHKHDMAASYKSHFSPSTTSSDATKPVQAGCVTLQSSATDNGLRVNAPPRASATRCPKASCAAS